MAEVYHRYIADPATLAAKAAERKAAQELREAEAKRKEAEKRSAARLAHRGVSKLRRERAAHEKLKRLRLEMQVAAERGELIRKDIAQRQAAFLLTAMRSRCLCAPSAWCRKLLNVSDLRVMVELLREMMMNLLEELSNLPAKVTRGDLTGDGDGEPLSEDGEGLTGDSDGESS